MKEYFTEFNPPPVIPSVPGTGKQPLYRLDPMKDEVFLDGEEDLQELINASADSVDCHKILARFRQDQDETLLQIRSTISGDMTVFPGSVLEAQQKMRELQEIYANNSELRARFKDFADFSKRGLDPSAWAVPKVPEEKKAEKKEGVT